VKPAEVRYYIDADVLGLAKVLAALRPDVTYPGDPGATIHKRTRAACPITKVHTDDDEWIPVVAENGWLVITRDARISTSTREIAIVKEHGARLVAIAGKEGKSTWPQLEIVLANWRRIEGLLNLPGPFIYTATRTALAKQPLD